MTESSPTQELVHQHRLLLEKMRHLHQSCRSLRASFSRSEARQLMSALKGFFEGELASHIRVEEEVLFPAFEAAIGGAEKWTGKPRAFHRDLSTDMEQAIGQIFRLDEGIGELKEGEASARLADLEETMSFLRRRFGYHIKVEEKYLFPEIEKQLPPLEKEKLGQRLKGAKAA